MRPMSDARACAPRLLALLRRHASRGARGYPLLGTSGTVTTLASVHLALPSYDRRAVDGLHVPIEAMQKISGMIAGMDYRERSSLPCIGSERADLVVAGCAILEAIMEIWPARPRRCRRHPRRHPSLAHGARRAPPAVVLARGGGGSGSADGGGQRPPAPLHHAAHGPPPRSRRIMKRLRSAKGPQSLLDPLARTAAQRSLRPPRQGGELSAAAPPTNCSSSTNGSGC